MTIHLEATIPAAPERVYELLTNGAKLGEAGDMPGKGGGAEGAYFSLFGDGSPGARSSWHATSASPRRGA